MVKFYKFSYLDKTLRYKSLEQNTSEFIETVTNCADFLYIDGTNNLTYQTQTPSVLPLVGKTLDYGQFCCRFCDQDLCV